MLKEETPRVTGCIHKTRGFEGIWRKRGFVMHTRIRCDCEGKGLEGGVEE